MSHSCCFIGSNGNKSVKVVRSPQIIEPLIVDLRGNLEEMLIQAAGSPTPDIHKQATRPREYNITVFDDVLRFDTGRTKFTISIAEALSKLFNLQYRNPCFTLIWAKLLHCKAI